MASIRTLFTAALAFAGRYGFVAGIATYAQDASFTPLPLTVENSTFTASMVPQQQTQALLAVTCEGFSFFTNCSDGGEVWRS